jgi:hypothetical protein
MPAKPKTKHTHKKWLVDTDNAELATDQTMERILKRDGRRIYEMASGDFLSGFAAAIAYMDGGPKRLLGMLRRLDAMYVMIDEGDRPAVAA